MPGHAVSLEDGSVTVDHVRELGDPVLVDEHLDVGPFVLASDADELDVVAVLVLDPCDRIGIPLIRPSKGTPEPQESGLVGGCQGDLGAVNGNNDLGRGSELGAGCAR